MEFADVVVVGGRCAGSSTARLIAGQGRSVVVLERGRLDTDVVSTLYIQPPGMAHLSRWGLLDKIAATGAPELPDTTVTIGGVSVSGRASWPASTPASRAPRRSELDPLLAEAAAAAGADIRERASMSGADVSAAATGGVSRVRYTSRSALGDAVEHEIETTMVIGADGMRSPVASAVGASTVREDPVLSCAYYTYWSGLTAEFATYENDAGWVSSVPTSGGLTLVSAYFPQSQFEQVRHRAFDAYLECLSAVAPALHDQVRRSERSGPVVGFGDQRNFIRRAAGPGWALVGDAGIHKDSLTARGIGDAFVQASVLAHHLEGLDDLHPSRAVPALQQFEQDRDSMLMGSYHATLFAADPANRPSRQALLSAVAEDSARAQDYFDAIAGLLPLARLRELSPRAERSRAEP